MTALVIFVRELAAELKRRADAIDAEGKTAGFADIERDAMVAIVAASTVMRQIAGAIEAAAKKALCT